VLNPDPFSGVIVVIIVITIPIGLSGALDCGGTTPLFPARHVAQTSRILKRASRIVFINFSKINPEPI